MREILRFSFVLVLFAVLALPVLAQAQRPAGGGKYDQQIQQDVNKHLQSQDAWKNVHASVEDGIVTLQGTVPLYENKLRLDQKVHNLDHVQGVRNEIVVGGPTVPDQQLRNQLADRLRYDRVDEGITFNSFSLGVNNGIVTISGQARTPTDRDSALSIVDNTPGVKGVNDEIQVLPVSNFDDQLRIQVARAIYGDPALQKYAMDPQAPIRIIVDNGHVTLDGIVDTAADKQIADMRAKSVPGVFSVKDNLIVASQQPK